MVTSVDGVASVVVVGASGTVSGAVESVVESVVASVVAGSTDAAVESVVAVEVSTGEVLGAVESVDADSSLPHDNSAIDNTASSAAVVRFENLCVVPFVIGPHDGRRLQRQRKAERRPTLGADCRDHRHEAVVPTVMTSFPLACPSTRWRIAAGMSLSG